MDATLENDLRERLISDYSMKRPGAGSTWLQGGKCPHCSKKTLYAHWNEPWTVRCNRSNNCGFETTTKDLYPDLFDNWSRRYPSQTDSANPAVPANPNATADAYLSIGRRFDLARIAGTYTQESFYKAGIGGSATVRFQVDPVNAPGVYWERIIDQPHRFGKRKATFRGQYGGWWWSHPQANLQDLRAGDQLWITEGVFDAIALQHANQHAVSTLSTTNYPEKALDLLRAAITAAQPDTDLAEIELPTLVWAFDADKAGSSFAKKSAERAAASGWPVAMAQPTQTRWSKKSDWNDLWAADKLTPELLDEYLYNGSLAMAKEASEKAMLIYQRKGWGSFPLTHGAQTYWFQIDFDKYNKAATALESDFPDLSEEEIRAKALANSNSCILICTAQLTCLYFLRSEAVDESWYHFRIHTPYMDGEVQNTFTSAQLTSGGEFKKRLLALAPGALWTGMPQQLDRLLINWTGGNLKTVQTIDFVGYSRDHGCWVFPDVGMTDGRVYPSNDEQYIDLPRNISIKTLLKSIKLDINTDLNAYQPQAWFDHFYLCFGPRGLVALAYWLGTFFAEQIRAKYESFPFLEIVGAPGSGKSTLIELLWRLCGRAGYEGFDPMKGSMVGHLRTMAQVSNLPVVFIESDRDRDAGSGRGAPVKQLDWDSFKSLYNGGSLRTTGVKTSGNETYDPQFRAALVIAQNNPVQASPPIMERIVHLYFDKSGLTTEGRDAALELKHLGASEISNFMAKAITCEAQVMEKFDASLRRFEQALEQTGRVPNLRLQKNHAQLMVLVDCLQLLVPITKPQRDAALSLLADMAAERERALATDHPIVEQFWEAFDYLDAADEGSTGLLNHSRDPQLIAVNLNHYIQIASERRQQVPLMADLKKYLSTSKSRPFVECKPVSSAINENYNLRRNTVIDKRLPGTVRCWVFKRAR